MADAPRTVFRDPQAGGRAIANARNSAMNPEIGGLLSLLKARIEKNAPAPAAPAPAPAPTPVSPDTAGTGGSVIDKLKSAQKDDYDYSFLQHPLRYMKDEARAAGNQTLGYGQIMKAVAQRPFDKEASKKTAADAVQSFGTAEKQGRIGAATADLAPMALAAFQGGANPAADEAAAAGAGSLLGRVAGFGNAGKLLAERLAGKGAAAAAAKKLAAHYGKDAAIIGAEQAARGAAEPMAKGDDKGAIKNAAARGIPAAAVAPLFGSAAATSLGRAAGEKAGAAAGSLLGKVPMVGRSLERLTGKAAPLAGQAAAQGAAGAGAQYGANLASHAIAPEYNGDPTQGTGETAALSALLSLLHGRAPEAKPETNGPAWEQPPAGLDDAPQAPAPEPPAPPAPEPAPAPLALTYEPDNAPGAVHQDESLPGMIAARDARLERNKAVVDAYNKGLAAPEAKPSNLLLSLSARSKANIAEQDARLKKGVQALFKAKKPEDATPYEKRSMAELKKAMGEEVSNLLDKHAEGMDKMRHADRALLEEHLNDVLKSDRATHAERVAAKHVLAALKERDLLLSDAQRKNLQRRLRAAAGGEPTPAPAAPAPAAPAPAAPAPAAPAPAPTPVPEPAPEAAPAGGATPPGEPSPQPPAAPPSPTIPSEPPPAPSARAALQAEIDAETARLSPSPAALVLDAGKNAGGLLSKGHRLDNTPFKLAPSRAIEKELARTGLGGNDMPHTPIARLAWAHRHDPAFAKSPEEWEEEAWLTARDEPPKTLLETMKAARGETGSTDASLAKIDAALQAKRALELQKEHGLYQSDAEFLSDARNPDYQFTRRC